MPLADIGDEAILLAGGGRAILLQLANPAVGHAVADHSNFAADPLRRLRNTLTFVYALVYGTDEQKARMTALVNAGHRPVRSVHDSAVQYDAADARLQLWVAATLYDTAIRIRELTFGPLPDLEAEAVYREYAIVGTALGMPAELWPADRAAFRSYWEDQVQQLRVDDRVLAVSRQLLYPRTGPLWLRAAMPLARLVTAGLLPPELRVAYELPLNEKRYARVMRWTARIYPRLPRRLRSWPRRHSLAALDRSSRPAARRAPPRRRPRP
ncbi:oxygenase MpaB family protein [Lacisediminihabitans changchengi]|uniref:DUF2236 domain-containing protein n=1 Tax=Lacisediminihabitans changchengi TaxID=2787634 RepID=A0A934SMY1_9MICO|nr:oxygenase MpaB family protein [Lacisediminihabitans changchengi]MBK4348325.1 DUF2236 domain-containing protein [Lacisediminihabitans changchengi]